MNRNKAVLIFLSLYVTYTFVRGLFPVSELPPAGYALFENFLDAVAVIGLVGLSYTVFKAASAARESTAAAWLVFGVVGVFAGLGILVVRAGGRPQVQLPAGIKTYAATPPYTDTIKARLRDEIASHDELYRAAQQSRWFQSKDVNVYQPGQIARDDLADYREIMGKANLACSRILDALRAAEANHVILPAQAKKYWEANYSGYEIQSEQMKLLLENWSEWHRNGFRPDSPTLKPWQKEVVRLQQKLEADTKTSIELHRQLTQP